MIPETFDAGTGATLHVDFLDKNGNPSEDPSAVYATIRSLQPQATLRTETQLDNPAASMDIAITSAENAPLGIYALQWRRVILRAVYSDGELVTHLDYLVRKL